MWIAKLSGLAVVLSLVFVGQVQAQQAEIPRLIQFSGVLQNRTGQTAIGVQSVTFALYGDQEGGAPLWLETQNVMVDEQGRYAALLGAATSDGIPLRLFSAGESRWLGVQVNLPSWEEQPRALLVSVPYALKAADADTLGGKPASAYMLAPETDDGAEHTRVKSKSMNSEAEADVTANATAGDAGYLGMFANATDLINSNAFQTNGMIGINTTNPGAFLQVKDSAPVGFPLSLQHQRASVNGDSVGLTFNGVDNFILGSIRNVRNDATGTFDIIFQGTQFGGIPTDAMIFKGSGNVGIGSLAPTTRLQVQDPVPNTFPLSVKYNRNTQNGDFVGLGLLSSDGFQLGGIKSVRNNTTNSFDTVLQATAFGLPITDVLTAKGNGNVGIGTSSPNAKLDVSGTVKATALSGDGSAVTNVNAATLGGVSSTAYRTRGIVYLAGCDTCSLLTDSDDQKAIYIDIIGPMTINSVSCLADAGSPTINIQRDDGSPANILPSALTCNGTATSTFVSGENNLLEGHKLNFEMVNAGTTTHRITLSIKATVN